MRTGSPDVQFVLPQLPKWGWNLLVGLFVLFAVELLARNVLGQQAAVAALVWQPFGNGFAAWQPLTRYAVQGNDVFNVVISLVVLYFFLPAMAQLFDARRGVQAFGAAALGGTMAALAFDLLGLDGFGTFGWSPLVAATVVYFGLGFPDATIRLFFIIPVQAVYMAYGSLALAFLYMLSGPGMHSADHFGAIVGAFAWWNYLGPGGRRRQLLRKEADIQQELRRFQVLKGGKDDDDDIVH